MAKTPTEDIKVRRNKIERNSDFVSIRVPRDLGDRLREIGKAEDRSLSNVVRRLVLQALESQPTTRES